LDGLDESIYNAIIVPPPKRRTPEQNQHVIPYQSEIQDSILLRGESISRKCLTTVREVEVPVFDKTKEG
jgi:hypothetical protein